MSDIVVNCTKTYDKTITCVPDKSITHRALMFNALTGGAARITNALFAADTLSTAECLNALGASVERTADGFLVSGGDFKSADINVGDSGTTARLMCGLLCGKDGTFSIDGDAAIRRRPMNRVITPLSLMGAKITSNDGKAPLNITGAPLKGIDYEMPVASAQVKSAILLAGLNADGVTTVREKIKSRDHTERMLKAMGADISVDGNAVSVKRGNLSPLDINIPGDISSAAFPLCLAAAIKGGRVTVKNVGVNPTRDGLIRVLESMGADISLDNVIDGAERTADITLKYTELKPFKITADIVPSLIDEIPALCALACFVDGESEVRGAHELRVKESDRIKAMTDGLTALGADVTALDDGMIIRGGKKLKYGVVNSLGDHRVAMALALAARAGEGCKIMGAECVGISYPNFFSDVL